MKVLEVKSLYCMVVKVLVALAFIYSRSSFERPHPVLFPHSQS